MIMLTDLANPRRGRRASSRLRRLGDLLALAVLYQRPGIPAEHLPPTKGSGGLTKGCSRR